MSDRPPNLAQALQALYGSVPAASVVKLKGDASTRRYYRVTPSDPAALGAGKPRSFIAMQLPEDAVAQPPAPELPFLEVRRRLVLAGIAVPQVYLVDLAHGILLLEDLGDESFEARLHRAGRGAWPELYGRAIDLLADMHVACRATPESQDCVIYRRRFDAALVRAELDHFREYGVEALYGTLPAADRAELDQCLDALTARIAELPQGFVHRDYQSRNLMWAPDGRLVVIDFQDALLGPQPYDLVALLCDSYVELDAGLQRAMVERYAARRDLAAREREQLERGFHLIAVQRKLKDAGRFVFLDRVRKNPDFLGYYPQSLRYVARALAALPELAALEKLLERVVPGFPDAVAAPQSGD